MAHAHRSHQHPCRLGTVLLLLPLILGVPLHAHRAAPGATFEVTRFDDPVPGACVPGDCSLREAVIAANGAPERSTILLSSGTYSLTLAGRDEDLAATGDLDLRQTIEVSGTGAATTIIDAGGIDRVLDVVTGTREVLISGVTLRGGNALADGGGNLRARPDTEVFVISSTVSGGRAFAYAGGILNEGLMWLDGIVVRDNLVMPPQAPLLDQRYLSGGGIANAGEMLVDHGQILSNTVASGLAITWYATTAGGIGNTGTVNLYNSIIAHNLTVNSIDNVFVYQAYSSGAGILNTHALTLVNCTVSQNHATYSGSNEGTSLGGGIADSGPGTFVEMVNATIADNEATANPGDTFGGGLWSQMGAIRAYNTLLALNAINSANQSSGPDCSGVIDSLDYNLVGITTGCTITGTVAHNLYGVDPRLGPLADNGGATLTHALLPGSPAIDGGDNTYCRPYDQRGMPRPQSSTCDIGAFEARLFRWFLPAVWHDQG